MSLSGLVSSLTVSSVEYYIVNVTPYGYEKLAVYFTYAEADHNLDYFCNVYPHGYIDILSEEELTHADIKEANHV